MRHRLFYMNAVSKLINNRTHNSRSEWGTGGGGGGGHSNNLHHSHDLKAE